jgi:signal transduction histidine kinase
MLGLQDLSITKKLTWMNMLVSGAALCLAGVAFIAYDVVSFRLTRQLNLSIQAQIIGSNSASALLFNDPRAAENTLAALEADPHVKSAGVYTKDGKLFAAYSRDRGSPTLPPQIACEDRIDFDWLGQGQVTSTKKILFNGKVAGAVYTVSDLKDLNARIKRFGTIVIFILSASLIAAFLISSIFRRIIAQPIVQLSETARIVTREKRYSIRADPTGNHDEMSDLIMAFNEMLKQIQERDDELRKARDELEQKVQHRTAELDATNKELEAFTYSVAHDLRAPLRHIDGFSRMLEDETDALTDEAKRFVKRIREGARRMGQLVDDLLNLARLGRKELSLQVAGLSTLVEETAGEVKAEIKGRSIEWKIGALPFVECDPGLMKQVFVNLLSNAAKYSRPREHARIEVGATGVDGQYTIFVRDNGVGFSMKYADKLFGVFQRLHRAEDFEGTGVGLATVQRIIRKHGGRVWAESELDKGATFYFTLGAQNSEGSKKNAGNGAETETAKDHKVPIEQNPV